jgi:hypothetical protein
MNVQPYDLPAAALDDYVEYRRQGGRFDLGTWWTRYKDDYTRSDESRRDRQGFAEHG